MNITLDLGKYLVLPMITQPQLGIITKPLTDIDYVHTSNMINTLTVSQWATKGIINICTYREYTETSHSSTSITTIV